MGVFDSGIKNAKIRSVWLGREDHGILTAYLTLEFGDGSQSFGGFCLDEHDRKTGGRKFNGACGLFVSRVMEVVGVERWEDLPGKSLRVDSDHMHVDRIGHFLEDKWFDPKAEFEAMMGGMR